MWRRLKAKARVLLRRGKDSPWAWDWRARPTPPESPIYTARNGSFVDSATFWAEVEVGGGKVVSDRVKLKVKAGK